MHFVEWQQALNTCSFHPFSFVGRFAKIDRRSKSWVLHICFTKLYYWWGIHDVVKIPCVVMSFLRFYCILIKKFFKKIPAKVDDQPPTFPSRHSPVSARRSGKTSFPQKLTDRHTDRWTDGRTKRLTSLTRKLQRLILFLFFFFFSNASNCHLNVQKSSFAHVHLSMSVLTESTLTSLMLLRSLMSVVWICSYWS